jgi:serine/threonine-protein kinase
MYIAMEYLEGRDLKELLASGHCFPPSEVARIAADVAVALDYAHSLGVVHRDIKPANIILADNGSAKITDFGIARLETSNLTVDGQFIGTPNFMSPEQITGKDVDGRSDIFSLGVVLFTLLTGQRPFAGDTMHEVTLRIVQEPDPLHPEHGHSGGSQPDRPQVSREEPGAPLPDRSRAGTGAQGGDPVARAAGAR